MSALSSCQCKALEPGVSRAIMSVLGSVSSSSTSSTGGGRSTVWGLANRLQYARCERRSFVTHVSKTYPVMMHQHQSSTFSFAALLFTRSSHSHPHPMSFRLRGGGFEAMWRSVRGTHSTTRGIKSAAAAATTPASMATTATRLSGISQHSYPNFLSYETLRCYYQLSKFRLSLLVTLTAAAGFVIADRTDQDALHSSYYPSLDYLSRISSLVFGVMATSASANTLNQVYEIARDAKMRRTMNRPLPSGRVSPRHAVAFALVAAVTGTGVLYTNNGTCAAALAAANIGLYAGIYTPMKVISISNTWIGAVVGAIPPLIGWVAAHGEGMDGYKYFSASFPFNKNSSPSALVDDVECTSDEELRTGQQIQKSFMCGMDDPAAYVLPALLYFWQLPHFMSLAWIVRDDYALGGYRMLPVIDKTGRATAAVCLRNCLYLLPVGFFAVSFSLMSYPFAIVSTILNVYMADAAMKFLRKSNTENARLLFRRSLYHLPIVMGAAVFCKLPSGSEIGSESLRERRAWGDGGGRVAIDTKDQDSRVQEDQQYTSRRELLHDIQSAPFPFLPPPSFRPIQTNHDSGSGKSSH